MEIEQDEEGENCRKSGKLILDATCVPADIQYPTDARLLNEAREKPEWDAYNENKTLMDSLHRYKEKYGFYPEAILADKIYRTRENRDFCKSKGIRMSSPKLGRSSEEEKKKLGNRHIKIYVKEMKWKINLEQAKENIRWIVLWRNSEKPVNP